MKKRLLTFALSFCVALTSLPGGIYADVKEGQVKSTEEYLQPEAVSGAAVSAGAIFAGTELTEEQLRLLNTAKEALAGIAESKTILALIYLTDFCEIREEAYENSKTLVEVPSGQQVHITGVEVNRGGIWYKVYTEYRDKEYIGYVQKQYLAYSDEDFINWETEYMREFMGVLPDFYANADTYADVAAFPANYQDALMKLKKQYPSWTFVKMDSGVDWNKLVKAQMGNKSWVPSSSPESWKNGASSEGWSYASEMILKYYLDPRNFFNETSVFQFELLTYNQSYHTKAAVQGILEPSFMKGAIPDEGMTYAEAFCEIGQKLKISPFHLAGRVYQEQGVKGTSALISGTYPGYEGYYNYFNVKASGTTEAEIIKNGLEHAKSKGWNTRYKSLEGGADLLSSSYIKRGQDTLYLQKFDVRDPNKIGEFQYMQNIMAPASECQSIKKAYTAAGALNNAFVFKIPVYQNMPAFACSRDENVSYRLTLDKNTLSMEKGGSAELKSYLNGEQIKNAVLTWSSDNKEIADVDKNGVITAKKGGTAVITAKAAVEINTGSGTVTENLSVSCKVTVGNPLLGISFDKTEMTLTKGETGELTVILDPEDTTDDVKITWTTSNKAVAAVLNGKVTAAGGGTATVTAKAGQFTAECQVEVQVPLESIQFHEESVSIYQGQEKKLALSYKPYDTTENTDVVWKSSNPSVATAENGIVKAVSAGKAVVTASMGGISAEAAVEVKYCGVVFHNENGGTVKYTLNYGETLNELLEAPEKQGYVFAGWYTEEKGKGREYKPGMLITEEVHLYPYWIEYGEGLFILPIGKQIYTGSAIKPEVVVYDGEKKLEAGVDYKVAYKNNTKVSAGVQMKKMPVVTVTGKGDYSGSASAVFDIEPKNINEPEISIDDILLGYNKKTNKFSPVIKRNGKKLVKNKDYKLTYLSEGEGAYSLPGTYQILVSGIGGYTGERIIEEVITNKTLAGKLSVSKIKNQAYTGNEIMPEFVVKHGKTILEAGKDYTYAYSNNREIGTAALTITGLGDYAGNKSISFKITGKQIKSAKVSGILPKVFAGADKALEQDYIITFGADKTPLIEGKDYILKYSKNTQVGTAEMLFTGIGEYTGTLKKTFKITQYDINRNEESKFKNEEAQIQAAYEKGGSKPSVSVSFDGTPLEQGKDYILSYRNHTQVNDGSNEKKIPTILIIGKGNFKGTVEKTFKIAQKDFGKAAITVSDVVFKNQKNKYKAIPVITDTNDKKLAAGTDYEKSFVYTYVNKTELEDGVIRDADSVIETEDIPPVGTQIRVSTVGKGNYGSQTISAVYRIAEAGISGAKVTIPKKIYTGAPIILKGEEITVKVKNIELKEGIDYIILEDTYLNNVKKGNASVTIKGIGNYGGSKKVTFGIKAQPFSWR